MLESAAAFTLFDKVLMVLGLLRDGKERRSKKTDEALTALYAAIAETKAYIQQQKDGKVRDHQREYKIASLWHEASVPLRVIDVEFAERCFLKGGYWMEPEAWDQASIDKKRISIDKVFEATRELLADGRSKGT